MMLARLLGACLSLGAILLVAGPSAAAPVRLPIPLAAQKAAVFAKRTCAHDESCVRSGVSNCRRKSRRVVLCRIFLRRRTVVQGKYQCSRLIRLAPLSTRRAKVTGIGRWNC
ncbi:MAG TPA: hypothetical protein VFZ41_01155 [Solirubrobacterales bacterium]